MEVLTKIQEFLDNIELLQAKLSATGFKTNQANLREFFNWVLTTHVTKADMTLKTIDDSVLNLQYPIPIRTYLPKDLTNPKVAIFCHGGGNICGGISSYDPLVRNLVNASGMIIISIDYRLSPEFAYPTSINDVRSVIAKVFEVLDERKIAYRSRELTLIGDSAGAAINATIVNDRSFVIQHQIKNQVLIYPSLDYTLSFPSMDAYGVGYFITKAKIIWYFENYFQNGENLKKVSPLFHDFYPEMPRSLVVVAGYDPLQDEGQAYYEKLVKCGIDAELLRIEGVVHGYLALENLCPAECGTTYQEIGKFLAS